MLAFETLTLQCARCKAHFALTPDEQAWFRRMGFTMPRRCRGCRLARRQERAGGPADEGASVPRPPGRPDDADARHEAEQDDGARR